MKWNFLFIFSSLFTRVKTGGPVLDSFPIPEILATEISTNLAAHDVVLNPLVVGSSALMRDTSYSEEEKEAQVNITTTHILKSLRNPERFCRLTTAVKKSLTDRNHAFVPLEIEVATEELSRDGKTYRGIYDFLYHIQNIIYIALSYLIDLEQQYVFAHELWHFFWRVQNVVNSTAEESLQIFLRYADFSLTPNEKGAAPYNNVTKASFIDVFEIGERRIPELKKMIKDFHNPISRLRRHKLNPTLTCLMEETKSYSSPNKEDNSNIPLVQLLNQLEHEFQTLDEFYSEDMKFYEKAASLALLDRFPKTRHYLFHELEDWYSENSPLYREYLNCISEVAPSRTSSCRR